MDLQRQIGFNSLQTGRCIQSGVGACWLVAGTGFQFPSNGKVYPKSDIPLNDLSDLVSIPFKREGVSKVDDGGCSGAAVTSVSIPFKREGVSKGCKIRYTDKGLKVSIPFKREGVSKATCFAAQVVAQEEGFNSLQTGRCIQSRFAHLWYQPCGKSFNSLQTGRCIQRQFSQRAQNGVHGRFQFPSNGKVYPKERRSWFHTDKWEFQFPSNGKVYPKRLKRFLQTASTEFQFPFKREGVSKEKGETVFSAHCGSGFQFPSNGKVYPKSQRHNRCNSEATGFNSLQTGRCIQRLW